MTFPLLGDADRRLSELFGVRWPLVRVDRRVTFLIGPGGVVEDVIKTRVYRHLDDVLATLAAKSGDKGVPAS